MEQKKRLDFLQELARAKDGANMWRAGEAIGLNRDDTEALSLDLLSGGLLEMVNLSGGVRLTEDGLASLGEKTPMDQAADLASLIKAMEDAGDMGLSPEAAADMAVDLATLRAQLKRSRPLPAAVNACLSATQATLEHATGDKARRLAELIAKFME